MSKPYYTPSLDELCDGMEILWTDSGYPLDSPESKKVFKLDNDSLDNFMFGGERDTSSIRVPYLTKTDIEAEGYKEIRGSEYPSIDTNNEAEWYIEYRKNNIIIRHYYRIGIYRIIEVDAFDGDIQIFKGTIKNKSEFKKLLKMLGI